jgi:hypothetical protein
MAGGVTVKNFIGGRLVAYPSQIGIHVSKISKFYKFNSRKFIAI